MNIICIYIYTGWWFGTCFMLPFSWEENSQLTFALLFFRGVGIPPTSYIPVIIHILMVFSTIKHRYHPFIDGGRSTTNQLYILYYINHIITNYILTTTNSILTLY